jgi:5-formyltetrahydrofolate cyclo-ligase
MGLTKKELREHGRTKRANLPAPLHVSHSRSICRNVSGLLNGTSPVMVYVSKPPEVDTIPLIKDLIARNRRVVVPIIETATRELRLSYLDDLSVLVPSTFSVPEPIGHEVPANPEELTIAIIPLLAFDSSGHRLGYGAGYYDRFLSCNPRIEKVGVAFSCQEVDAIPADEYDVPLDAVVTEEGIVRF